MMQFQRVGRGLAATALVAVVTVGGAMSADASIGAIAGGSVALASPAEGPEITIDGHEYGQEDGLVIESDEIVLPRLGSSEGSFKAAAVVYQEGSSYASTKERLQLWYDGESKAAANVYGTKRIIQVCFAYKRDGKNVSDGTQCSKASHNGRAWVAGGVKKKSVRDSLNPSAPQTKFSYSTVKVDKNVVP